jgi:HEPN domain-containing protein
MTATSNWIESAEADFNSALRALRDRKHPTYGDACFHARQSAEKYLKGCAAQASICLRNTRDLRRLVNQLLPSQPAIESLLPRVSALNHYTIDILYPGKNADRTQAREAVAHCREIRRSLRVAFGLPAN